LLNVICDYDSGLILKLIQQITYLPVLKISFSYRYIIGEKYD
jgi:hypothetical protein